MEWLHAKASYDRWHEEIRLLKAEGQRVGKSFEWLKKQWLTRKGLWELDVTAPVGASAYASRCSQACERLQIKAERHFAELLAIATRYGY